MDTASYNIATMNGKCVVNKVILLNIGVTRINDLMLYCYVFHFLTFLPTRLEKRRLNIFSIKFYLLMSLSDFFKHYQYVLLLCKTLSLDNQF